MREDRPGFVVERWAAILTQVPLILSIAAVFDHRLRPAARATEDLALANLLQQVRGARLWTQQFKWEHCVRATHRVTLARYAFTAIALPDQQSASEERKLNIQCSNICIS